MRKTNLFLVLTIALLLISCVSVNDTESEEELDANTFVEDEGDIELYRIGSASFSGACLDSNGCADQVDFTTINWCSLLKKVDGVAMLSSQGRIGSIELDSECVSNAAQCPNHRPKGVGKFLVQEVLHGEQNITGKEIEFIQDGFYSHCSSTPGGTYIASYKKINSVYLMKGCYPLYVYNSTAESNVENNLYTLSDFNENIDIHLNNDICSSDIGEDQGDDCDRMRYGCPYALQ